MNAAVTFPVKKINIEFSYSFAADNVTSVIVTTPLFENNCVGNLCKFQYFVAGPPIVLYHGDGFKKTNQFSGVFYSPKNITTAIPLVFNQLTNSTFSDMNIVAHMEFLG